MDRCVLALSSNSNPEEAFSEVVTQLQAKKAAPILIIVFSEINLLGYCAKLLQKEYQNAIVIGCSTYVNFSSEGYSHSGISVMAINEGVECTAEVVYDASNYPCMYKAHITKALNELSSHENTCCLEFTTAFTNGEDLVLDTFQEALEGTNITVIGGTAGADAEQKNSLVTLNGELYTNSCVFVFIHNLNGRIKFFKENIYRPTKNKFVITDVDCEHQLVYEYNGLPAADVMAEVLGVSMDQLAQKLAEHPMGRIVNNDIQITQSNKVREDGAISYLARIYNHTKMVLLEADDLQKVWSETVERIKNDIDAPSFCISVSCLLRSQLFERNNKFGEFVNTLRNFGCFIGVSGYGEQLGNVHFNQTMVLAVFE